jgi:hypothetical protein
MTHEVEGTFEKLKAGAKAVAKKISDPDKDLGNEYDRERGNEDSTQFNKTINNQEERSVTEVIDSQTENIITKDPMSPEKIASHEPTAVKRDANQNSTGDPITSQSTTVTGNTKNSEYNKKEDYANSSSIDTGAKSNESTAGIFSTYSCEECGKSFGSRQELKEHTAEH